MGKAKKLALKSLPAGWRERMWARASDPEWLHSRPQLLPALALLWLTECRPAEIERGVRLLLRGNHLAIEVSGAKCVDANGRERGQPKRHYAFKIDQDANAALMFLRALAAGSSKNEAEPCRITHSADYLYNSVVALAKSTFPTLRTRISPYCFRHQIASDLKADPAVTLEDAAKFMGHLSDYSIGKYGHAIHGRRGRGGMAAPFVQTARPIKHSPKVDRLARFKIASAKRQHAKPR